MTKVKDFDRNMGQKRCFNVLHVFSPPHNRDKFWINLSRPWPTPIENSSCKQLSWWTWTFQCRCNFFLIPRNLSFAASSRRLKVCSHSDIRSHARAHIVKPQLAHLWSRSWIAFSEIRTPPVPPQKKVTLKIFITFWLQFNHFWFCQDTHFIRQDCIRLHFFEDL